MSVFKLAEMSESRLGKNCVAGTCNGIIGFGSFCFRRVAAGKEK